MVTKAKFTGLIMAATLVISVPLVYADTGNSGNFNGGQAAVSSEGHHGNQHGWKHGREGQGFWGDLSDTQRQQLKDNMKKQHEAMKAGFEQVKTNREALAQELANPTPDMTKIGQIQTQLKALQAQRIDDELNSMLEVKKILTPEQYAKFLKSKQHQFKGHGHRMHRNYCEHRHHR